MEAYRKLDYIDGKAFMVVKLEVGFKDTLRNNDYKIILDINRVSYGEQCKLLIVIEYIQLSTSCEVILILHHLSFYYYRRKRLSSVFESSDYFQSKFTLLMCGLRMIKLNTYCQKDIRHIIKNTFNIDI